MTSGSAFTPLRWPGMAQAGVVSAVAYDSLEPVPRWHRGMPSSWLPLIVTVGEPIRLHGSAPGADASWPATPAATLASCLAGLHERATAVRMQGFQRGVQLALHPLAAPRLLGLPAAELVAGGSNAADVLGPVVVELRERMAQSRDLQELTAAIQGLCTTADRDEVPQGRAEVAHAWREVQRSAGCIRVDMLAQQVGLSTRQLRTLMRRELGVGPKTACRLARLDAATHRMVSGSDRTLADTALASGYADHAHLNAEFTAMVGCSPSTWLAQERGNIDAGGHRNGSDAW